MPESRAANPAGPSTFCIWIVSPSGYAHSRCFEELALSLSEAFAELGLVAPIVTQPDAVTGTAIVLGANLLRLTPQPWPKSLVLYNLEQSDSPWFSADYVELLRRHPVWDYSNRNIAALAAAGVNATLCGVGYSPGLTRIPHVLAQDIDVCFVGSINPRRAAVLDELRRRGMTVRVEGNIYGAERDALYARSKIVLNVHHYEAQLFEIVRVSYLLANRVCVVSEVGREEALEAPFRTGAAFAYYGAIPDACGALLARPDRRRALAQAGFEAIKAQPQAPMLAAALAGLADRALPS